MIELVLLPLRGTGTRGDTIYMGGETSTHDMGTFVYLHIYIRYTYIYIYTHDIWWFTFPGISYERDCYLRIYLEQ